MSATMDGNLLRTPKTPAKAAIKRRASASTIYYDVGVVELGGSNW